MNCKPTVCVAERKTAPPFEALHTPHPPTTQPHVGATIGRPPFQSILTVIQRSLRRRIWQQLHAPLSNRTFQIHPHKGSLVQRDELPDLRSREKVLIILFRGEMSKRISPAFAVTEGKVHLALPETCLQSRLRDCKNHPSCSHTPTANPL